MANIALEGAHPSYFNNINDQGLPILDQAALDKVLSKYKSDTLNSGQYRDNWNTFGWNVKSDGSFVKRGTSIVGLSKGLVGGSPMGGGGGEYGIVKTGTNAAPSDKDYKFAAGQLGIDYNNYIKPTRFVPASGPYQVKEVANAKNSREYADPITGETYLARIDNKGNYKTSLDQQGLFADIDKSTKDLYLVANALDRTGVSANKKAPHAAVLFKADGSGNLVPVQKEDGSIAATPYSAVGVEHRGASGQFADLAPILGIAGLAFGLPALTSSLGGATGALTAGQVGALGAAEAGIGTLGLGAGAGLGTGTMAGTMLGAGVTGAGLAPVLGSTAALGAGSLGALGGATGGLPSGISSGWEAVNEAAGAGTLPAGTIAPDVAEFIATGKGLLSPEGLPYDPYAKGYEIGPEGPAKIGNQCLGFKGSTSLLDTAKKAKSLYDAGKSLFGGNQPTGGGGGGGGGGLPQFLDSNAEFLNKNPVIAPVAGLKDVREDDLNVESLNSNDQSGQGTPRKEEEMNGGLIGYADAGSVNSAKTEERTGKGDLAELRKTWEGAFCADKLIPKFVKCETPEFLRSVAQQRNQGLKQLRQGLRVNPLATGGLPHKYAAAAPKGHKPEFITGMTGYYACGAGTGQSDDIPAMLHDGDYVMDAETVSALGDGSSKAGRVVLEGFREKIPHKKEGGSNPVPAKIADGEYVFPEAFVTALGGGDNKRGAEILDGLRTKLRAHKRGAPLDKIPPKAKDPIEYIKTRSK